MSRQRRFAPAKLNLYLHVTGRRADGFHTLDGLVAFADVGDEIAVEPAETTRLALLGPFAAMLEDAPRDNLAWRAAEGLASCPFRAPLVFVVDFDIAGSKWSCATWTMRFCSMVWRGPEPSAGLADSGRPT